MGSGRARAQRAGAAAAGQAPRDRAPARLGAALGAKKAAPSAGISAKAATRIGGSKASLFVLIPSSLQSSLAFL
jgi:regulator of protease activity HflC (stomatin/prohibitin superfamily)